MASEMAGTVLWALWSSEGFRHRRLSLAEARRLRREGETVVPDDYAAAPSYAAGDIWRIASETLEDLVERANRARGRTVSYGEPELRYEDGTGWVFWRQSPTLQSEGWIPGAVTCRIDKLDLHVWTDDDFEEFARWQGASA